MQPESAIAAAMAAAVKDMKRFLCLRIYRPSVFSSFIREFVPVYYIMQAGFAQGFDCVLGVKKFDF